MVSTDSLSGRTPGGRKRRAWALLVAVTFVLVACGGGGSGPIAAPSLPGDCTAIQSPSLLRGQHIPVGAKGTYNTTPPSSGEHYATPAGVGGYVEPIPNEVQVHNLEHGHVMVQYKGLTSEQIDALEDVVKADARKVLMAPYPDMDAAVALTSWGKIQTCSAWSAGIPSVAQFFIDRNRDHAPESVD
ncbi:MAG: DUF3105 domain-containing protein [Chloroflexi bacterium]|nr:DUF3105 domain-containing protein [Chloroflexota bacterium]